MHIRPNTLPTNDTHIELQSITKSVPEILDQLSPQLVQEILKASSVDISKFKHYKCCIIFFYQLTDIAVASL